MLTFSPPVLLALLTTIGLLARPIALSDPVGIEAVVDKVVIAPDTAHPSTIQIWGVFALTDGQPGDHYGPAARGYLYFSTGASNPGAVRAEWSDLQSLAGKKQVVGFGAKYRTHVRLRCPTEAPADPDTYSFGVGIVKTFITGSGWKGSA